MDVDIWNCPLLFSCFVKRKIYTIPRDISFMFLQERVVPGDRQNISSILANSNIKEYDVMKLIDITRGRCCQDSISIKPIKTVPEYIKLRQNHNLCQCSIITNQNLLCFFNDETVKKVDLSYFISIDKVTKVIENKALLESLCLVANGYFISFNNSIDIPAADIYAKGTPINLSLEDFKAFINFNTLDTTRACEILACSRQNLSYLSKKNNIIPVKKNIKGNMFLTGDILKNKW